MNLKSWLHPVTSFVLSSIISRDGLISIEIRVTRFYFLNYCDLLTVFSMWNNSFRMKVLYLPEKYPILVKHFSFVNKVPHITVKKPARRPLPDNNIKSTVMLGGWDLKNKLNSHSSIQIKQLLECSLSGHHLITRSASYLRRNIPTGKLIYFMILNIYTSKKMWEH